MPIRGSITGFGYGGWQGGNSYYQTVGKAQWATYVNNDTSLYDSVVNDMICDNNYNLYVCGYINANGGSGGIRSLNAYDVSGTGQTRSPYYADRIGFCNLGFLVKYNQLGICQWISMVDQSLPDYQQSNRSIALDSQQNIYVGGIISNASGITPTPTNFYDSSGFGIRQSQFSTLISKSAFYVYKMNPNGKTQWVNYFSTNTGNIIVVTSDSNNVYYGGTYNTTGYGQIPLLDASGVSQSNSLYSLPNSLSRANNIYNGFIVKLNSNGKTQWSVYMSTVASAQSLTTDKNSNLYCAIDYGFAFTLVDASGFQQVNNAYTLPILSGQIAGGLIKYNTNGIVQWCTCILSAQSGVTPKSVKVDSQNNVYVCGTYKQPVTFRDASGTGQVNSLIQISLTANAMTGAFLAKYNSNGVTQWVTKIDSSSASFGYINTAKITVDTLDNVYIVGTVEGPALSGQVEPIMFNASGNTQIYSGISISSIKAVTTGGYVAKYTSSGICLWATYLDNPSQGELFNAVASDRSNSLYIGGECVTSNTLMDACGNTQTASAVKISSVGLSAVFMKYR